MEVVEEHHIHHPVDQGTRLEVGTLVVVAVVSHILLAVDHHIHPATDRRTEIVEEGSHPEVDHIRPVGHLRSLRRIAVAEVHRSHHLVEDEIQTSHLLCHKMNQLHRGGAW